jgi:outer membrane immunogenic protein
LNCHFAASHATVERFILRGTGLAEPMGGNHMKKLLVAGIAAAAFCGAPAFAADMPVKAPPLAAPFNWAGFYVGAYVGGVWGTTHVRRLDSLTTFTPIDADPSGVGLGGLVGYNFQNGRTVFGLEGDAGWLNAKGTDNHLAGGTFPVKVDFEGRVRGRIGYAIDRMLPFIAGGVSFGDERVTLAFTAPPRPGTPISEMHPGWNIGGGLDYAFQNNLIGRIEYIYDAFSNSVYGFSAASGGTWADRRIKFDTNTVRAALVLKL